MTSYGGKEGGRGVRSGASPTVLSKGDNTMEKMEVENMFLQAWNRQYYQQHIKDCRQEKKVFIIENVDNNNEQKS